MGWMSHLPSRLSTETRLPASMRRTPESHSGFVTFRKSPAISEIARSLNEFNSTRVEGNPKDEFPVQFLDRTLKRYNIII